eukprot:jgi/Chlat1/7534/Chrsp62S07030
MNGVMVVSLRGGACLFSKAHKPNFGLPSGGGRRGEAGATAGSSEQQEDDKAPAALNPALDAMGLSGLLYALSLHAAEAIVDDDVAEQHADQASSLGPPVTGAAIQRWHCGEAVLHMRADVPAGVIAVIIADATVSSVVANFIVEQVLRTFCNKFGKVLTKLTVSRAFSGFTTALLRVYQQVPEHLMGSLVERLGPDTSWMYVAHSSSFSHGLDRQQGAADGAASLVNSRAFSRPSRYKSQPTPFRNPARRRWHMTAETEEVTHSWREVGMFQYFHRQPKPAKAAAVPFDSGVLDSLLSTIHNAAEVLAASGNTPDSLHSLEICIHLPASQSARTTVDNPAEQVQLLVQRQGAFLLAMPLLGSGIGGIGPVLWHELCHDITQLRVYCEFLAQVVPVSDAPLNLFHQSALAQT